MNKQGKEQKVQQYDSAVGVATYAFLADYQRIPVVAMEQLRAELRGMDAGIVIMKNTLAKIVFERHGLEEVSEYLAGPSMLVYGTGEIAPVAKHFDRFTRINRDVKVKAVIYDGSIFKGTEFKAFTTMPTKDEVRAKFLGTLQAPLSRFLSVNNAAQRLVTVFSQYAEKQA
jgi:large subunit ribosomal protein L10